MQTTPEAAQLQTSVARCGMLAHGCQGLWGFFRKSGFWGDTSQSSGNHGG